MSIVRRVAKNTGILFFTEVISKTCLFVFIMYMARYLGAEGFGILFFALSFTKLFSIFANFGLSPLTIREVARDKSLASKYFGNVFVMKIFSTIITFGLIALTINLLGYPNQTIKVVYFIALFIIVDAFIQIFYSIFKAFEKMGYVSIGQTLHSILLLFGALFAIKHGFSVVGFATLYFISSLIVLGYTFSIYTWNFGLFKIEVDWNFWKHTIKKALPFALSTIFVAIYFDIDSVMLSLMKGNEVVGWYTAAYRLVYAFLFIPSAYFMAVYPIMSRLYKSSEKSLKFGYNQSVRYMMILAFPLSIAITLLADKIVLLIYGHEFSQSVSALHILIWAVFFSYMSHAPSYILYSVNKQSVYTKVVFLCMILNILLNLMFIPKMSYVGASFATVITECVAFLLLSYYVGKNRHYGYVSYNFIVRLTISTLGMGLFIVYFNELLGLGLVVVGAAIIYLFLLLIFQVFTEYDVRIIKNLIK